MGWGGGGGVAGADDKFILVVKMVYGKMSAFSQQVSYAAWQPLTIPAVFSQTSCHTPQGSGYGKKLRKTAGL